MFCMMPFSVSANASLSAPFVGYNIYYYDYDTDTYITNESVDLDMSGFKMTCSNMLSSGGCMTYQESSNADITGTISLKGSSSVHNNTVLKIEVILDSEYVGYVNITHGGTAKNYYVNGNKIEIYTISSESQTITVNSYSLNKISEGMQWAFPIESYPYVYQISALNYKQVGFLDGAEYIYPIYETDSSKYIARIFVSDTDVDSEIVLGLANSTVEDIESFNQFFTYNSNYTLTSFDTRLVISGFRIFHVKFRNNGSGGNLNLKYNTSGVRFIPIYIGRSDVGSVSTDFALIYGFSNDLLDALVYGSNSSIQSSSDLDDSTSQLSQDIISYTQIENSFNDDMNSYLQDIDTSNNLPSAMGSKFLTSANWVRVQFNRMTENTPFGSLLGFSLVLGISLLIIGKVYK